MGLLELLIVVLLIVAIFGHPRWSYGSWGYRGYGGGIGLVLILLIILLLFRS